MKRIILCIATILVASLGAIANENCNIPQNPAGSCQQTGFVCNLGFNVVGEDNIMFFQLGTDATCTNLLESSLPTHLTETDTTLSASAKYFLIENEENMGPLSLTLAGSLAMLAVNNNMPVEIIYKKVKDIEFGGIKLLSIKLVHSN